VTLPQLFARLVVAIDISYRAVGNNMDWKSQFQIDGLGLTPR
jgi:hypothetical protein